MDSRVSRLENYFESKFSQYISFKKGAALNGVE